MTHPRAPKLSSSAWSAHPDCRNRRSGSGKRLLDRWDPTSLLAKSIPPRSLPNLSTARRAVSFGRPPVPVLQPSRSSAPGIPQKRKLGAEHDTPGAGGHGADTTATPRNEQVRSMPQVITCGRNGQATSQRATNSAKTVSPHRKRQLMPAALPLVHTGDVFRAGEPKGLHATGLQGNARQHAFAGGG